ncbi:MAG: aminotransferase class III-fold pyridoxal phosphate-dependent enzyme, partial [Anaerolineae bacterium]
GKLFGVDHWNVEPDIICMAKSLGGGVMPVSAFGSRPEIWEGLMNPNPFMHTTTTGGNPLACAAAIAAISVTLEENLPAAAADKGSYFIGRLQELAEDYPMIYERITGRGLLIGQHFVDTETGYKVASGLFKRGVLVAGTLTNAKSIRIEPPIYITREQMDTVLERLDDTLKEIRNGY